MKKKFVFLAFLFTASGSLWAQQLPIFNQTHLNPFFYNPALAGGKNHAIGHLTRRQQFGGQETPALTYFSFNSPVEGEGGFGINFFNSHLDTASRSLALVSFGRAVPLAEEELFYFGIAGGFGLDKHDLKRIDNSGVPGLQSAVESNFYFDAQIGAHYTKKRFSTGLVLPSLIKSDTLANRDFSKHSFSPFRNLYLNASYLWPIVAEQIEFEPRVAYRLNKDMANQWEMLGVLTLQKQFWIGGGYRQDQGGLMLMGIQIQDLVYVGYSYEFKSSLALGHDQSNHELHMGVRMGQTRIPPRKGFIRKKEKPEGSEKPRFYYEPKNKKRDN